MKYKVAIREDILGKKWYAIQSKRFVFSKWRHVSFSLQESLKEITALKILLEQGESVYSPFKPSCRVNLINTLNN